MIITRGEKSSRRKRRGVLEGKGPKFTEGSQGVISMRYHFSGELKEERGLAM